VIFRKSLSECISEGDVMQSSVFIKVREIICDCFVTGKWKESEDAAELLQLDDDNGDELFGDFEDLETGEKHTNKTENINKENVKGAHEGKQTV
jgi:ribosome biogenesis protein BMS1